MRNKKLLLGMVLATVGLVASAEASGLKRSGEGNLKDCPASLSADAQLTDQEVRHLVYMREEEKLARDVYLVMSDLWTKNIFVNIAKSEQQHMNALLSLIRKYGLRDPVVDDTVGVFTNPVFTKLFNDLVAAGSVSEIEAFKVGVTIEELDIEDLEKALAEIRNPDLRVVFENLLAGSYNHLAAFLKQLGRFSGTDSTLSKSQNKMAFLSSRTVEGIAGSSWKRTGGSQGFTAGSDGKRGKGKRSSYRNRNKKGSRNGRGNGHCRRNGRV